MNSPFLVVGESVLDLVVKQAGGTTSAPGGSPANVAVALGRLGNAVTFMTEVGDDVGGRLIRQHLETSRVAVVAQTVECTPRATTRIDAQGTASYEFDLAWTLAPPLAAPQTGTLHLGSLGAVLAPGAAAVTDLLDRLPDGVVVSYDPNCRPALMGDARVARAAVETLVARAHVVKASHEDLAWLYPDESAETVAGRWQALGPALVVVTLGGAGSLAVTATGRQTWPAVQVNVRDTIGAGDSFMAGLLHRLGHQRLLAPPTLRNLNAADLVDVLEVASAVAAVNCSRVGADPPWRVELAAHLMG